MKVFLDDEREAPTGWVRVRTARRAIEIHESGDVEEISLDHDLGEDAAGTGYDVVLWMEERVAAGKSVPPVISVHTANPAARQKMEAGIRNIKRIQEERKG